MIKKFWILIIIPLIIGCPQLQMPGDSYSGTFKKLNKEELVIQQNVEKHVQVLAGDIGHRDMDYHKNLEQAAKYIEQNFLDYGAKVSSQSYVVGKPKLYEPRNIEAEFLGKELKNEILVVGAHYDSVDGSPGANDNATGVAALLEIGKLLSGKKLKRTIKLVAFVNEEPPYFDTKKMGSYVYAQRSREREENIIGMISLETLGYYDDEPSSQQYPFPLGMFKPDRGNFVAFVSNISSKPFLNEVVKSFRKQTEFPSDGVAFPEFIPGIGWSDHSPFWKFGYLAIMVTDTAPFRYPYYHTLDDTPDEVQYDRLARVVLGIFKVIEELVNVAPPSKL